MTDSEFSFICGEAEAGRRIDQALAARYSGISRAAFQRFIASGGILVNGEVVKRNYALREGDRIKGRIPPAAPAEPAPESIPLDIIYSDDDLIVLNKPPGLVVHPAAGNADGTLVNALLHHFDFLSGVGGVQRPGIVHRLDKDTSGLLLVARNDAAHQRLQEMIQARTVKRHYLALVQGEVARREGRIDAPIGRHPHHRKKMAVLQRGGRDAVTEYRRLASGHGLSLVEARLQTGRTHQIRAHFAHLKHPVVGDSTYGWRAVDAVQRIEKAGLHELGTVLRQAHRQMLHAWRLSLPHPITEAPLVFTAAPPDDFQNLLKLLAWDGEIAKALKNKD